ncbi:MAG: polyamine ABC transporter ATP-binding protein [Thermoplasmata archaeon]|nr:MAG: polyamine ABC transporter ATP-binding protein [Thermoplasmata archaeon]
MVEIELKEIHFTYPRADEPTLRGFSLRLREGKLTSLLGPSGEGKTTVLKIIAGFLKPHRGMVLFDGEDVSGLPPEERGLGIVFQNYALFPHMTVYDNVAFGLRMRGWPRSKIGKRLSEVLKLVGLEGYERRLPRELSGGEQQRLALARALAPRPQVLLLDEPLSALDAALRGELRREIRRIQREIGVTTLYITHDQSEALYLSDHVAILLGGRVVQEGPPEEVYLRPLSLQVARFLEMENLLDGKVVSARGDQVEVEVPALSHIKLKVSTKKNIEGGAEVVVGIRPFHIELLGEEECGKNILSAEVKEIEFTGKDYLITLSAGSGTIKARTTPVQYDRIRKSIEKSKVAAHLPEDKLILYPAEE